MYRYMRTMYRYNAPTRQKFEISPFVSTQHVDVSIHKPLYRYQTSCINTGPCQDQNMHSVKECIDTYQHVSIQGVHSIDTMVHSIDTLIIVSIQCSLYRYRQGFWAKCIDTLCNVSKQASYFHGSGNFNSSTIDPKLNFNPFLCIRKD